MTLKRLFSILLALAVCPALLAGCGNSAPSAQADLSYTQADPENIPLPADVRVVGLGEASHGVAEYHKMKAEVFKSLVESSGCRTFIIEGDFGGALRADAYINGGEGTAREAACAIGFAVYQTQEMVDLIEWMRAYNETVLPDEALHFYGMDVQRFDCNKEYLFSVLSQTVPKLSEEYTEALAQLTDANRNSLDEETLGHAKETVSALIAEMDAAEAEITAAQGSSAFDFARECANTLLAYCTVQLSESYNTARDACMAEKVEWFLQHGDGSLLFINGHNGHIAKTSVAGYPCLGGLLAENLGSGYYAIGTDARKTRFNSQKDEGGFEIIEVSNANELNSQLAGAGNNQYFIDFASAQLDKTWYRIQNSEQTITTLNVGMPGMMKLLKFAYTAKLIPQNAFDGMIVFDTVAPSTLLDS